METDFILSDIDECSSETDPCDDQSYCVNTVGSYSCPCKQGFTHTAKGCSGISVHSFGIFKIIYIIYQCVS